MREAHRIMTESTAAIETHTMPEKAPAETTAPIIRLTEEDFARSATDRAAKRSEDKAILEAMAKSLDAAIRKAAV